jgi:hypothetical protein
LKKLLPLKKLLHIQNVPFKFFFDT